MPRAIISSALMKPVVTTTAERQSGWGKPFERLTPALRHKLDDHGWSDATGLEGARLGCRQARSEKPGMQVDSPRRRLETDAEPCEEV